MTIYSKFVRGRDKLFRSAGFTSDITFIAYTIPSDSYDDDTTQAVSGTSTTSGVVFPVTASRGSTESLLLEQGKLTTNDKMLYVGSANLSGNLLIDINNTKYGIIPNGIETWEVSGSVVLNKIFIRQSTTGSLY